MRSDDPRLVRDQYETEDGLAARAALYLYSADGVDARDVVVELAHERGVDAIVGAVTNGSNDFEELWSLVGRDVSERALTFRVEHGEAHLRRHFATVERRDLVTPVSFPDSETMRRYVGSSELGRSLVDNVPELTEPFVATKVIGVFVAEKAA